MADCVKDAVLLGECHDLVLLRLIELTAAAILAERPLYPSLMEEPVFYRCYFARWVEEALEERKAAAQAEEAGLSRYLHA